MPRVFCLTYCRPLLSMAVTPAIIAAGVEKTGQVGGWTVLLEYSLGLEAVQGRLYMGGCTREALQGRLYKGDCTREAVHGILYKGDCTRKTVQGRVKQKDLNQKSFINRGQ